MKLFNNEKAVSEVVGAMMILLILVLYLGVMQTRQVPEWNKELEIQHFDVVYDDFITMRSNIEDSSSKNIPRTSSIHMGIKYPDRFLLANPGPGASGIISTYPLKINISYNTTSGLKWKNYTSMGIIYDQNGISDSPLLVYENGLVVKDYGNGKAFAVDENQSLTTKDNIFIPIIYGTFKAGSSMDIDSLDIQPVSKDGFSQSRFSIMNATIETRYPGIWKNMSNASIPVSSNLTIDNGTACINQVSDCITISNVPGYNLKKLNFPNNNADAFQDRLYTGVISFDNTLLSSRGATGSDGQDMWDKYQGRLDIPSNITASEFRIQDITMARTIGSGHDDDDHDEEHEIRLRFSVADTKNLWTVEIKFEKLVNNTIRVLSIRQKYPSHRTVSPDIYDGLYNFSYPYNITDTREINLTKYYTKYSNISTPNALTIDRMDSQILYVNFVIN